MHSGWLDITHVVVNASSGSTRYNFRKDVVKRTAGHQVMLQTKRGKPLGVYDLREPPPPKGKRIIYNSYPPCTISVITLRHSSG
jgi:hypothetical protein